MKSFEKTYPHFRDGKSRKTDLYTDLYTLSTENRGIFTPEKTCQTEQLFCEVVTKFAVFWKMEINLLTFQ